MNKIKGKIYCRITFCLASALSVGSGENRHSDSDVVRDSAGDPFIPGSSLAGIYRSLLEPADAGRYLGTGKHEDTGAGSKVVVYDARLRGEKGRSLYRSSIRDCVGLDQWKTGKEGCKFDFEVVEPGAEFVTYLEQNLEEGDRDILEDLAGAWQRHEIALGRKTMRGLGAADHVTVRRRAFDFTEDREGELDAWLDFDIYREEDWEGAETVRLEDKGGRRERGIRLEFKLRQRGGISIRRYTTAVSASEDKPQPDAEQLTWVTGEDGAETPYIPGTSWAGAFLHHMGGLALGCTKKYFGSCERRSQIRFHESFIQGASPKVLTRNAVDRFTGGVVDNALFTEKMWYGGRTLLCIDLPAGTDPEFCRALAAALTDLHMGILPVGGLTAVGRGIFEGEELLIDGASVPVGEEMYGEILERLERR